MMVRTRSFNTNFLSIYVCFSTVGDFILFHSLLRQNPKSFLPSFPFEKSLGWTLISVTDLGLNKYCVAMEMALVLIQIT